MKKMLLKNVLLIGSNVCITIENGKITAAAPDIPQTPDMEVFDGQGKLGVLPPFYNAHNHAAMTLLRSYAEDMELFDWLSNHIWPAEAKLSAEDIYIGTKLAAMEMIRSGTVWFNDSYWHPEAAVRAVRETGMRATLGMLYLNGVSDDAARANELLIEAAQDVDLISVSHTPHAIYTVDKPTLQNIAKMLEKDGRRLHIHVSETAKEVADCQKEHGMTPVEYLDSLGLLSERAMLAHCVHLSDRDREIIAERQAYIAHNPVSNMKLCSGMFDFEKAQAAGCRIAIGTDGTSSNNNLSMLDEMKCAALTAKVVSGKPTAGRNLDILARQPLCRCASCPILLPSQPQFCDGVYVILYISVFGVVVSLHIGRIVEGCENNSAFAENAYTCVPVVKRCINNGGRFCVGFAAVKAV